MALFAKHKAREFGLLNYTEQSPSCDTFERVIGAIGRDYMESCVVNHGKKIMDTMNEKHIAIDGKQLLFVCLLLLTLAFSATKEITQKPINT